MTRRRQDTPDDRDWYERPDDEPADDGDFEDPEDAEERERAAARGKTPVDAWGDSDIADGEDGEEILKRMARSHAELAIRTLADVAVNGVKDAARTAAANSLLARGFGTPTRRVEQKVDVTVQDHRAAHYRALQELASRTPVVQIEDAAFEEIEPATPRLQKRRKSNDDD